MLYLLCCDVILRVIKSYVMANNAALFTCLAKKFTTSFGSRRRTLRFRRSQVFWLDSDPILASIDAPPNMSLAPSSFLEMKHSILKGEPKTPKVVKVTVKIIIMVRKGNLPMKLLNIYEIFAHYHILSWRDHIAEMQMILVIAFHLFHLFFFFKYKNTNLFWTCTVIRCKCPSVRRFDIERRFQEYFWSQSENRRTPKWHILHIWVVAFILCLVPK